MNEKYYILKKFKQLQEKVKLEAAKFISCK